MHAIMTSMIVAAIGLATSVTSAALPDSIIAASLSTHLTHRDDSAACTQFCSDLTGCLCLVRPADCVTWYMARPNDNCVAIAQAMNNFTVTQLYQWNPEIGQTCLGLQAYVPLCIGTSSYNFVPPVQPPAGTHETPNQIPVPIMPNVVANCQVFELVAPGVDVYALARENGFNVADFAAWNGGATSAWANYWACVKA